MEDKMLVRTLLEYLMKNASHENRAVTRHNLDLIKTMLECWQKRISGINTDVIYEQCSRYIVYVCGIWGAIFKIPLFHIYFSHQLFLMT